MGSLVIAATAFVCVIGGALAGILLRAHLPKEHLAPESRDVVKLAMGIIATMTAVVMGMLVASAKTYYDTQSRELTEMSGKILLFDRVLAHYGPEAQDARTALRDGVVDMLERTWPKDPAQRPQLEPMAATAIVYEKVQALSPQNDAQRSLQSRALSLAFDVGQTRMLMFAQASSSISMPLLLVVVFSLTITFASFGLHAVPNPTWIATLILCALSVAATILLILEMYTPFHGLIQIPSDPLRNVLAQLGR